MKIFNYQPKHVQLYSSLTKLDSWLSREAIGNILNLGHFLLLRFLITYLPYRAKQMLAMLIYILIMTKSFNTFNGKSPLKVLYKDHGTLKVMLLCLPVRLSTLPNSNTLTYLKFNQNAMAAIRKSFLKTLYICAMYMLQAKYITRAFYRIPKNMTRNCIKYHISHCIEYLGLI